MLVRVQREKYMSGGQKCDPIIRLTKTLQNKEKTNATSQKQMKQKKLNGCHSERSLYKNLVALSCLLSLKSHDDNPDAAPDG
jgi:hypothetical protein